MRKVVLNMKQEREYQIIKKLVETNGNKKSAALKLDCSLRTINRKIAKYKQYGKAAFIHGNTGRKPATTISGQTRKTILDLFNSPVYLGVNITHFIELLEEVHDIKVSNVLLYVGFEILQQLRFAETTYTCQNFYIRSSYNIDHFI